jgi:S-formylglutathione hydrolase
MRFAAFVPAAARGRRLPVLFYLAGLTCTEETFTIKAGAQRVAAELGMILVMPDTSPREPQLPGDRDSWDFGQGAGFYVDATQAPWSANYRMFSYVTEELPALVDAHFPTDPARRGVFGHSMGGHGALVAALRRPDVFRSCSAFAPISAPMECPWGHKALGNYLGSDQRAWAAHDASLLIASAVEKLPMLVDQGDADAFLATQLRPDLLEAAALAAAYPLRLRMQRGYDHGYFFVSSFIGEHIAFHAGHLHD